MPNEFSLDRRALLLGSAMLLAASPAWADVSAEERLRAIEARSDGRLGVAALDTGSGKHFAYRGDERFAMCSTFKFLLVACILRRVDAGAEKLDREIAYGTGDMLDYAPVTKKHLTDGRMRVRDLCAAAIVWSDNTAANVLLKQIGGPQGFTAFARTLGDPLTRLDRTETSLNTAIPGDPRDTTTPEAMLADMRALLVDPKAGPSMALLKEWMLGCQTASTKLRAGLPSTWRAGNKTGNGERGSTNDIAILWPPGRAPILVTSYYTGSTAAPEARDAVHADVGRLVAQQFG